MGASFNGALVNWQRQFMNAWLDAAGRRRFDYEMLLKRVT